MGRTRKPVVFPQVVNADELADAAGLSRRRIFQLVEERAISRPEKAGKYPFIRSMREIVAHLQQRADGASALKAADSARRERADADSAEIKAGKEIGALMLRTDCKRIWADALVRIREAVLRTTGLTAKKKKEVAEAILKIHLRDDE